MSAVAAILHASYPICQSDLHPPSSQAAKDFAWADGHWAIYITYV